MVRSTWEFTSHAHCKPCFLYSVSNTAGLYFGILVDPGTSAAREGASLCHHRPGAAGRGRRCTRCGRGCPAVPCRLRCACSHGLLQWTGAAAQYRRLAGTACPSRSTSRHPRLPSGEGSGNVLFRGSGFRHLGWRQSRQPRQHPAPLSARTLCLRFPPRRGPFRRSIHRRRTHGLLGVRPSHLTLPQLSGTSPKANGHARARDCPSGRPSSWATLPSSASKLWMMA
jgi:hypothetical protein